MENIKAELLGIGILLSALVLATDNVLTYAVGALGAAILLFGYFVRDKKD